MNQDPSNKKTAVAKLRERFFEIKQMIKPSEKLKGLLRIEPKSEEDFLEKSNKKIARSRTPEAGL